MLPAILLAEVVTLYFFGFYDLRALRAGFRPIVNSVTALFVHLLATTALYFFSGDVNFPRSVLIVYWLVNAAGLAAIREWVGRRLAASSPTRVLLVGTGDEIERVPRGRRRAALASRRRRGRGRGRRRRRGRDAVALRRRPAVARRGRRPAAPARRARRRRDRAAVAALVARSPRRPHAAPESPAARQRGAVGLRHPRRTDLLGAHPRRAGDRGREEPARRSRVSREAHHRLRARRRSSPIADAAGRARRGRRREARLAGPGLLPPAPGRAGRRASSRSGSSARCSTTPRRAAARCSRVTRTSA